MTATHLRAVFRSVRRPEPSRGVSCAARGLAPSRAAVCAVVAILLFVAPRSVSAQVHIEDLRVGFGLPSANEGAYKIGSWTPVRVKVRAEQEGFVGALQIATADSDDVETMMTRPINVPPNETIDIPFVVKAAKTLPEFTIRLLDSDGRVRQRRSFEAATGEIGDGASQDRTLIVTAGRAAGLDAELLSKRPGYPLENYRIAQVDSARQLPTRWFAYEAIDHLILCPDDPAELESMDVSTLAALNTWVRYGGHLVVSLGPSWDRVTKVLGDMMPADVTGAETVQELSELETYLGQTAPPFRISAPLSVPKLTNVRGEVLVGTSELPLVVRGPYGFGMVTVLALEVNRDPFMTWDGRTDFWIKVLPLERAETQESPTQGAWTQATRHDISSHLRDQLEQFQGIKLVPFQWVAFFIFLYILLIGPVDYWFVKKVCKRMEYTWITFPVIVLSVSVAAYLVAFWLKGDALRINKVDVVDIDQSTESLRGTSWFTLFSPQIQDYSVQIKPELAATPQAPAVAGAPSETVSWLGLAENAIGGMGRRQAAVGLFRRGYQFAPDAEALINVPIQVWSMKAFTARWHRHAATTIDAKLESAGTDRLRGTITNQLDSPLEDCILVFGRKVYPLGNLPVNGSVLAESRTTEDLKGHLSRRATPFLINNRNRAARTTNLNPGDLLVAMMFHDRLPEGNPYAANDYFHDMDLSDHLDHHRAIFVARIDKPGSQLILNGGDATGVTSVTYLRVILPVTPGDEPEYSPPGDAPR